MGNRLKFIGSVSLVCFYTSIILHGCNQKSVVDNVKEFNDYASGSGMAFVNKKIYLVGDDMGYVMVTDTSFRPLDTIRLTTDLHRIPKDSKPDIESVAFIREKKSRSLLLAGSGSIFPTRSKAWKIDLDTRNRTLLDLEPFYKRIQGYGIRELNIEGMTAIPGGMLLAHRGNKSSPKNFLLFTTANFWSNQASAPISLMKLGANEDTASFSGVSGLDYSFKSDRLFLTVSTENTYSSHADGAIGKSYLWIIDYFASKRRLSAINPSRVIDLESIDDRFKGHKIESVCITGETKSYYALALVADDDKGTSILFQLTVSKE